jgi:hypothetical protein
VGYWKFDEGDTDKAMDSSGSNQTGTLTGLPTWTNGGFASAKFPNLWCLTFNGIDDVVTVPDPSSGKLDFGTTSFSLSLWVWVEEMVSASDTALDKGGSAATYPGYNVSLGTGAWTFNIHDGTTARAVNFASAPRLNQWVHLVAVRDAGANQIRAYLNGALAGTTANATLSLSNTFPLRIGKAHGASDYPFKGQIDDVRIYNRVLTTAQITALTSGSP